MVGMDVNQSEAVVCTITMNRRAQGRVCVANNEWLAPQADVDHLAVGLEFTAHRATV